MLVALKRKAGEALLVGIDIAGMVLSISGAVVVAFVGKLMFSVVLLAVAVGFFLRLSGRRKGVVPAPAPAWARPVAALLAAVEVTALTEATNLPVRFNQPGFEHWHWALVAVALLVAYALNMRLIATVRKGQSVTAQS